MCLTGRFLGEDSGFQNLDLVWLWSLEPQSSIASAFGPFGPLFHGSTEMVPRPYPGGGAAVGASSGPPCVLLAEHAPGLDNLSLKRHATYRPLLCMSVYVVFKGYARTSRLRAILVARGLDCRFGGSSTTHRSGHFREGWHC